MLKFTYKGRFLTIKIAYENFLGRFGQFWTKFVALTVAESLPEARLKSLKSHNS
jgi:hypothetical protein